MGNRGYLPVLCSKASAQSAMGYSVLLQQHLYIPNRARAPAEQFSRSVGHLMTFLKTR